MFIASTPGVDFTNILQATFARAGHKCAKDTDDLTVSLYF
jgi:hypothetical protein